MTITPSTACWRRRSRPRSRPGEEPRPWPGPRPGLRRRRPRRPMPHRCWPTGRWPDRAGDGRGRTWLCRWRRNLVDVQTAPSTNSIGLVSWLPGHFRTTDHAPSVGPAPQTRASPPMLMQIPSPPAALASSTMRSAAAPFPDSSQIEPNAHQQGDSAQRHVEDDPGRSRARFRLSAGCRDFRHLVEWSVVADRHQRIVDRGIESAVRGRPRVDGQCDHVERFAQHDHRYPWM